MTGAYLRVQRDGKWQPIEVEYLTNDERAALFQGRSNDELLRWINMLCHEIAALVVVGSLGTETASISPSGECRAE